MNYLHGELLILFLFILISLKPVVGSACHFLCDCCMRMDARTECSWYMHLYIGKCLVACVLLGSTRDSIATPTTEVQRFGFCLKVEWPV